MGWPLGKPRKGYVKADGTPHAAKGVRLTMARTERKVVKASKPVIVVASVNDAPPEIHGAGSTAITEPCPICLYAYADGGACPDCGWMKPFTRVPYGTATGPKFKH